MTRARAAAALLLALTCACPAESPEVIAARYQEHKEQFLTLFRSGDYPAALKEAVAAIQLTPGVDEPYSWTSQMYMELGGDTDAVKFYEQLIQSHPDLSQPWFFKGFHEFNLDRLDDALHSFRRACELSPENPECHYREGLILDERGEFEEALAALRRSYELDPGSARKAVRLAKVLRRTGNYDEAEKVVAAALTVSPESSKLHHASGLLSLRKREYGRAEQSFRRALELDRTYPEPHMDLARVLSITEREGEALRERAIGYRLNDYQSDKRFMTDYRGNPNAPMLLAEIELTERNFNAALREFSRADRLLGPSERVAAGRAETYFRMGAISRGEAALAGVQDMDGGRALLARAARLVAEYNRAGATRMIERAVLKGPDERQFLRRAADLYADIGLAAESEALLERATKATRLSNKPDPEKEPEKTSP